MSTGKKVFENTGFLVTGQVVTMATGVVWTGILARYIGPEVYGAYAYFLAILSILVVFINVGFEQLLTRDLAQRPEMGWHYLSSIVCIKVVLSIIVLGGFMAYINWHGPDAQWVGIAIWVTIATFIGAFVSLTSSVLYAREAMGYETIAKMFRAFTALALGYIGVQMGLNFPSILALLAGATIFQLLLSIYFVKNVMAAYPSRGIGLSESWKLGKDLLRRSLPFLALMIIGILSSNIMMLLMKARCVDPNEVGYYASASRIYGLLNIVPAMVFQSIFPAFSRLYSEDYAKMKKAFEKAYRYIILLCFPLAIGISLVGSSVVLLIFGQEFIRGGQVLQILAFSLFNGVGYVISAVLLAMHRQQILIKITGGRLLIVGCVAWFTIPKGGALAGAWAFNLGSLGGFIVLSIFALRLVGLQFPFAWAIKISISSIIMGMVTWYSLKYVNFLIVSFLISPAVYIIILLLLRIFSPDDIHFLKQMLPRFIVNSIFWQKTNRTIL